MDNPFFTALEGNGFTASELAYQTNQVLMPFVHYLNNSIKALENKEVSCEWKPVVDRRYRLVSNKRIYQIIPISEIEITSGEEGWYEILCEEDETPLNEDFIPEIDDPVIVGKGANRQRFSLTEEDYQSANGQYKLYLPELGEASVIQWSGYQLLIRPLSAPLGELAEVHIDGHVCPVKSIDRNLIRLQGQVYHQSTLSINGQNTRFKLLSSLDKKQIKSYSPQLKDNGWLLFATQKPELESHQIEDLTAVLLRELTPDYLTLNDNSLSREQWGLETDKDGLTLEARDTRVASIDNNSEMLCARYPALSFSVSKDNIDEKWIQLIEKDSGDDTGKSELDHFFGDNIKILDNKQNSFRILKSRFDERQILLARIVGEQKNWRSEYPSKQGETGEIRVSVDTSQLRKQKAAINDLMARPAVGHAPLIHLLQDRQKKRWKDIQPETNIEWQVLTNPDFDGCDCQREFVTKALATPDFAILDGPPGTGKTTTILELIIQLVMQGKRVLLSASTHAAINNVLERIQENPTLRGRIFPLRIGKGSNATGVEGFHFDNLYQQLRKGSNCDDFSHQLMVDSSNLVCGTTIGILRLFNEREVTLDRGEPPFDVMIIDECSKTTFQEFLVPARFAKRWVLVGDVRQLSPFTDREQIVANLDNLMLVPPKGKRPAQTLSKSVQQACYLLEELRGNSTRDELYRQPMLVPVTTGILQALDDEISARNSEKNLAKGLDRILLVQKGRVGRLASSWLTDMSILEQEPWHLYDSSLCFVDEACMTQIQPIIPDDMLVLHPDWQRTGNAFHHRAAGQTAVKPFRVKTTDYSDTSTINKELLDRFDQSKWSEEVCWRLEREYWLRQSANYQKKTGYLSDTLERLFPKSVNADGRIHVLKNIAFPSILEALSGDGLVKRKKDDPTTLNQGFDRHEKEQRHSTLSYQHRMHPDISAFPRRQFYPEGVLMDGSQSRPGRDWDYDRYKTRNTWLDVQGDIYRNANKSEVKAIIQELIAFCNWAENKKKNDKGEAFDVAVLTFYKAQEKALREAMQKELPGNNNRYARFSFKGISIKLATVDYFQGQEADLVFLSMVNTHRDGFMDSPNRLNVSITRARYQLVIVGHHEYFSQRSRTEELKKLARSCNVSRAEKGFGKNARRYRKR
ncbi:AAA domain-containing protein [uncultured Photobacterium sp.]|uniref:AAA domain-containing protein n=1 Tax=uncultured Photobacterium sp. TaxID=173973 RepID=UPI002635E601|nr:AAA domain-containing protein [uncultured Photobacterium sp.]